MNWLPDINDLAVLIPNENARGLKDKSADVRSVCDIRISTRLPCMGCVYCKRCYKYLFTNKRHKKS